MTRKDRVDYPTCENCGAPMRPVPGREYFTCEYCGSFAFPKPSLDGVILMGEKGEVDCPVCGIPLSTASAAEVGVLHCTECQGVLAKQEAFSTIVKFMRAKASGEPDPTRPLNKEELERQVACPTCGRTMDTHPYYGPGNVVIDNCARCDVVWLDYGELAVIRDAPGRDRGRSDEADYSFIEDLLGT